MKWNWEHAIQMGLEVEPVVDEETGEPSTFLGIPLTTVGEYRRYDDESLEGQTMRTPLR